MTDQAAITIIADVRPDEFADLKSLLDKIGADAANNDLVPFARFPKLHFARFFVVNPTVDLKGAPLAPKLVFLADLDEPAHEFLDQVVDTASPGIDRIFAHCEGYPADGLTPQGQRAYLETHIASTGAFYANTIGRTVAQIKDESRLRDAIEAYLDRERASFTEKDAQQARSAIRDFVGSEPELSWALKPAPGMGLAWQLKKWLGLAWFVAVVLVFSPLFILVLPFWLVLLRIHEMRDPAPDILPDPAHLKELTDREDLCAQNQFTAGGFVKAGWFRSSTAEIALIIARNVIPVLYGNGSLGGVKTIHFARWVYLDGKKRLIFASNFDGSTESYNDDFIDIVSWGLNAIFSNGVGYPKTRLLLMRGAEDELAFKHYIRVNQFVTQAWYSAYPELTALNINNNAAIRAGLSGRLSEAATTAWLRRL